MTYPIDRSARIEATDPSKLPEISDAKVSPVSQQGAVLVEANVFSPAGNKQGSEDFSVQLSPPQKTTQTALTAAQRENARIFASSEKSDIRAVLQSLAQLLNAGLESSDDLEIDLLKSINETQRAEVALKIKELGVMREVNKKQMEENKEKIEKSSEAMNEAKKAGLAQKIFGWIAAVVSVVVGAIMIATGFGAVAGALMIAGGIASVVSMAVNQAAEDGLISKEAMKILGPVMMALVIVVAVASVAVSFGGLAVVGIAKLAAKLGTKGLEISAKLAEKAAQFTMKIQGAVTSGARSAKLSMEITNTVVSTGKGVADGTNSVYQATSLSKQADTQKARYRLDDTNKQIEILTEALKYLFDFFATLTDSLSDIQHIIDHMLQDLLSMPSVRPA